MVIDNPSFCTRDQMRLRVTNRSTCITYQQSGLAIAGAAEALADVVGD
jgi:hypothetical protein